MKTGSLSASCWASLRRLCACLLAVAMAVTMPPPSYAQAPRSGLPIIRDAEIEQLLRDYLAPILKVAGLTQQNVQVVIVRRHRHPPFSAGSTRTC